MRAMAGFLVGSFLFAAIALAHAQYPPLQLSSTVSRKTHDAQNFIYVGSGAPPPGSNANYGLDVYSGHNGINWDPIALSIYAPPTDEDLRDPAVLPIGDTWWIVHTAGLFGNVNYFSLIKSTDHGQSWSWVENVAVLADGAQTWSPRWLVDSDGSIHVFVASHTAGADFTLYELHPMTSDPAGAWSSPVSTGITGYYDNWEMKIGPTYYFFVAHGGLPFRLYSSSTITGGAQLVADLLFNGSTLIGPENQSIFVLENGWAILLYENGPKFATSSDLIHWSALTPVNLVGTDFSGAVANLAGSFDIPLPLSGNPGVECRTGGLTNDYTLIFTFSNNVISGQASLDTGVGTIAGTPILCGKTMTVNLSGVANAQTLTIRLINVTDEFSQVLPETLVSMAVLMGDTTGNGVVNGSDVAETKAEIGQAINSDNFRADVNANGAIGAADVTIVKSQIGNRISSSAGKTTENRDSGCKEGR
jgi:hypothetical protein